ncbi:MAG: hypothetical protein AVDCRST_MAG56-3230, partial [uncultured Cytophagales bacterium]
AVFLLPPSRINGYENFSEYAGFAYRRPDRFELLIHPGTGLAVPVGLQPPPHPGGIL